MKSKHALRLVNAKKSKDDEYYTLYKDIDKELSLYAHHFENKIIYCNADSVFQSKFYKYFFNNFNKLKLRKLITSCYKQKGDSLNLFNQTNVDRAVYSITDSSLKTITYDLKDDGCFKSEECLKLLKEADIVITNPPFSMFVDFTDMLYPI